MYLTRDNNFLILIIIFREEIPSRPRHVEPLGRRTRLGGGAHLLFYGSRGDASDCLLPCPFPRFPSPVGLHPSAQLTTASTNFRFPSTVQRENFVISLPQQSLRLMAGICTATHSIICRRFSSPLVKQSSIFTFHSPVNSEFSGKTCLFQPATWLPLENTRTGKFGLSRVRGSYGNFIGQKA